MNSVALIGNLTKDPELRFMQSGTPVCTLRIAVNDRKKNGSGEWIDIPYYFDVTCWNNLAERCNEWLAKGKKVGVTGKLTWREWETDTGAKRQSVEVTAFQVEFLTPRQKGEEPRRAASSAPRAGDAYADFNPADDDIPF